MGDIGGWFLEAGVSEVGGPGAKPPPPHSQSERDELTEDGEGSIRSSEDGAGDSGEWDWGPGAGMEHSAVHCLLPHTLAPPWHLQYSQPPPRVKGQDRRRRAPDSR